MCDIKKAKILKTKFIIYVKTYTNRKLLHWATFLFEITKMLCVLPTLTWRVAVEFGAQNKFVINIKTVQINIRIHVPQPGSLGLSSSLPWSRRERETLVWSDHVSEQQSKSTGRGLSKTNFIPYFFGQHEIETRMRGTNNHHILS